MSTLEYSLSQLSLFIDKLNYRRLFVLILKWSVEALERFGNNMARLSHLPRNLSEQKSFEPPTSRKDGSDLFC